MRTDALELGTGLPGWTLRALIAATAGAITLVLAAEGVSGVALGLLVLAGLISVAVPASPTPGVVLVLTAVAVVALGSDPFAPHVLLLVPLTHLLHVTCGIAGVLPVRSRLHLAALRGPAIRFAVVQAGVFALAGLMALVPAGRTPAVLEFAAIVGVTVIAGLLVWLLRAM